VRSRELREGLTLGAAGALATVSVLRDDAIDHRRPAVWSLGHDVLHDGLGGDGLAARSVGHLGDVVPGKTPNHPGTRGVGARLADPIRELYRMFRCADDAVRGYPPEVS
jgi:hypothetical protein